MPEHAARVGRDERRLRLRDQEYRREGKQQDDDAARYPRMVFVAASQVTPLRLKYDSFAIWHASAALWPKTTSSVTAFRVRTASKNVVRCGGSSSMSGP